MALMPHSAATACIQTRRQKGYADLCVCSSVQSLLCRNSYWMHVSRCTATPLQDGPQQGRQHPYVCTLVAILYVST